jgi:uncharacterized protein
MFFCNRKKKVRKVGPADPGSVNPVRRFFLITGGIFSLALGILGIPLPLLPTTPFLLLSAYLFARSSPRLYNWLIYHRVFGKYIRDYREKRGVPLGVKIGALALLWVTISLSAFLAVELWWVRVLLFVIAIGVTSHVLCLKTIK